MSPILGWTFACEATPRCVARFGLLAFDVGRKWDVGTEGEMRHEGIAAHALLCFRRHF